MAYIKIIPIKSTVKNAVIYITDSNKTDEQNLVSSFGCAPETADLEFAMTAQHGKDNVMDKGNNLAWHMIISFRPGEITDPKIAHEVGTKIAEAALKGKYEYVLSTHINKDHTHCHLIFNATSFVDYHKYVSNKKTYNKICKISNRICREYGLSESMPTGDKGRSYKENAEYNRGNSWKAKLKYAVDHSIWTSTTYEEFLRKMQEAGYEIRQGKYLAFRALEQKHFTNVKSLGTYYSEKNILSRLEQNKHKSKVPRLDHKIKVFIQIASYVENNDRPGFERWAKLNNLKEAAKTYNYLVNHNILNFEDFKNHISDVNAAVKSASTSITEIEKSIQQQQLIQKKCEVYRTCRNVVRNESTASNLELYRKRHKTEYQLHDITLQELHDLGINKLPSPSKLQSQLENLQTSLSATKSEKQRLLREQEELKIIESNFNSIIQTTLGHTNIDLKPESSIEK